MNLDQAYDNVSVIPGAADFPDKWTERAAAFRVLMSDAGRATLDQPYGDSPRQASDFFRPEGDAKGLCIFIHGGYWRRFDRSFWSHLANGPLTNGWSVCIPSYDLCPNVSIASITRQIAFAITKAAAAIEGPITLCGHSAGGHLVARMLQPGLLPEVVAARLTHIASISPISDLRPLIQTSVNAELQLDQASARAESPIFMNSRHNVPVQVWVGSEELPGFLDQARWLSEAWSCPQIIDHGSNHFTIIEALENAESRLTRACLGMA